ncbi:hypothetical protein RFI_22014 [Reticulomyxa filosa]|uniref:Uncharacterized protein n=1 Tax=Reticulomyxa filosa TaxID=46433 RepID=X6MQJ0_RETFI|nr:hypothetical protein RFI_22014 [Reticulomyxa filosa]|eukprot:ETO15350.1 hypothetical protein RFI_22014 [Reticulomyxa filosa]
MYFISAKILKNCASPEKNFCNFMIKMVRAFSSVEKKRRKKGFTLLTSPVFIVSTVLIVLLFWLFSQYLLSRVSVDSPDFDQNHDDHPYLVNETSIKTHINILFFTMGLLSDSKQRRSKGISGYGEFLMQRSFQYILQQIQYHYFEIKSAHMFDRWLQCVIQNKSFEHTHSRQSDYFPLNMDYFFFDEFTWIDKKLNIRPLLLCSSGDISLSQRYNCSFMIKRTYIFDYFGHFTWYAEPFQNWSRLFFHYLTPNHFLKAVRTLDNTNEAFLGLSSFFLKKKKNQNPKFFLHSNNQKYGVHEEIEEEMQLLSKKRQPLLFSAVPTITSSEHKSELRYGIIYGHSPGIFVDNNVRQMLVNVMNYLSTYHPQIRLKSVISSEFVGSLKELLPNVDFVGFQPSRQKWLSLLQNSYFLLGVGIHPYVFIFFFLFLYQKVQKKKKKKGVNE